MINHQGTSIRCFCQVVGIVLFLVAQIDPVLELIVRNSNTSSFTHVLLGWVRKLVIKEFIIIPALAFWGLTFSRLLFGVFITARELSCHFVLHISSLCKLLLKFLKTIVRQQCPLWRAFLFGFRTLLMIVIKLNWMTYT